MDKSVFTTGFDTGDFLLKAQVKVPASEFASPVLQGIVEKLSQKYERLIDKVLEGVEGDLMRAKAEKALRLVVFDGGGDDLFKAGKPTTGDGYTKVKNPGSKGGKFWIDPKGNVRYDKRPDGPPPSPKHREATDEEVIEHIKSKVTPTLFVGHDHETMDAILEAGGFDEFELGMIEWFRTQVLGDEGVLGTLDGIHSLDEIDARSFTSASGATGSKALNEWMEQYWYDPDDGIMDPSNWEGREDDKPDSAQAREWFEDLLKKYNNATKDPKVKEALKANFIRLQQQAEDTNADVARMAEPSANIGDALLAPANIQDGALVGLTLMNGMNLVYIPTSGKQLARGKSGKVNKRHLGQIHINEDTLASWRRGKIDLTAAGGNENQAMMFVLAGHMSNHKDEESGEYDVNAFLNTDGSALDDMSEYGDDGKKLIKFMEAGGKTMSAGEKKHLAQRLSLLGQHLSQVVNDQHDGQAPGVEELMSSNAAKLLSKPDAISAIRDKIAENLGNTKELLAAQDNKEVDLPKTGPLAEGKYGGAGKSMKSIPDHQKNTQTDKPYEMFSWQKQALNWMEAAKRGILAHGAGLGKTTSAVAFIEHMKAKGKLKRGIFFLPPALIPQWTKEIEDYAPGNTILDLSRYPAAIRTQILKSDLAKEATYILVSKGVLTGGGEDDGKGGTSEKEDMADDKFIGALQDIDEAALFTDEVHQGGFKNPENASHKVTQKVLTGREYAFGMTATPLPNAPADLFHLTNLFAPGTLGKFSTWEGRLAETTWNPEANGGVGQYEISNYSDLAELNARAKPRVFVKKFDDKDVAPELAKVLPDAPKPIQDYVHLDSKPGSNGLSQLDYVHHGIPLMVNKRIDEINKEREEEGEEPLKNPQQVARLLTLNLQRQATISPELIDPKYRGPAPKIDHCVQTIVDHFKPGGGNKNGKGIVVFCNFKKAFPIIKRELAKRGIDPSIIGEVHSDAEVSDRGATQDAFNGTTDDKGNWSSKMKIALVGIKAGGAGLNLQKGGNATYFLDEPFTAADKEQAIGRVFRVGQKEPVKITTVHAHNSYDQRMNKMIESKNAIAQALLARDSGKLDSALTSTAGILGVEVPKEPDAATMKKFEEMAHLVNVRANDIDDIWDSIQAEDGGGSLAENEIVVNPKAAKDLPPHLRSTLNMKEYVRERAKRMEIDNAKMYAKNDRLVAAQLTKDGKHEQADLYNRRAERLEKLAASASKKPDGGKGAVKEVDKIVKEAKKQEPPAKVKNETNVIIHPNKKNPYSEGSKKKVDSKRDAALGVADKDDHMTHGDMHQWYTLVRKHKPKTVGEFYSKVMKPMYQGSGATAEQVKETAQQIFHHLKEDGLIEHTAGKELK